MCTDCNAKTESDHVSLFSNWLQTKPSSNISESTAGDTATDDTKDEEGHRWFHSMILYQAIPEAVEVPSVEDRLESLESDFKNLEATMQERQEELSERLQRLEDMMSQLLSAVLEKDSEEAE